jgi:hypothetical protein
MEALVERLAPKVTEYQLVSRRCGGYGQGNDPAVTDVPCPDPFVRMRWITADRTSWFVLVDGDWLGRQSGCN